MRVIHDTLENRFNPAGTLQAHCTRDSYREGVCTAGNCSMLQEPGKTKSFAPGDVLFWDGDTKNYIYLIQSGTVRCSKILSDGRRQICRFVFGSGLLEYSREEAHEYTAEALTPVRAIAIPRVALEQAMATSNCLSRLILQVILDELHDSRLQSLALGRLSAPERVAQFLHILSQHLPADDDGAIELPMSRLDIADYLGLTIETVSRVISRMKREGQIRLFGPNRVRVMEELPGDCLLDAA